MSISAIVVNYSTPELTCRCIDSLLPIAGIDEIIVVDNASPDNSAEKIKAAHTGVTHISLSSNKGYGAGVNAGIARSSGDYILVLNSDIVVMSLNTTVLFEYFKNNPGVALIGMKLLMPNGTIQKSYGSWPTLSSVSISEIPGLRNNALLNKGRYSSFSADTKKAITVDWVTGAAFVIKKETMTKLHGFDEMFFMYYEDIDLCKRIRNSGFLCVYHPDFVAEHRHGASSVNKHVSRSNNIKISEKKSLFLFFKKHQRSRYSILKKIFFTVYVYRTTIQFLKWLITINGHKRKKAYGRLLTYKDILNLSRS